MSPIPEDPEPAAIDLTESFGVIRRHAASIAAITMLFVGLGFAIVAQRTTSYSSTVQVEVRPTTTDPFEATNLVASMGTEVTLVTSTPVVDLAAPQLGVDPRSPNETDSLLQRISVTNPSGSVLLQIACSAETANEAQRCAQLWAQAYIQNRVDTAAAKDASNRRDLQETITYWQRQRSLDKPGAAAALDAATTRLAALPLVEPNPAVVARAATLPEEPSNKRYVADAFLFGIAGLVVGIGIAFVRERMREPVVSSERMARAIGAPVLCVVPKVSRWRGRPDDPPVVLRSPEGRASGAFDDARAALRHIASSRELRVVEVVGAVGDEGITTVAVNLAIAMAQGGKRVVAVSCDLRRPRLHRIFSVHGGIGLTSVLTGEGGLNDATLPTGVPGLSVIPSGPSSDVPDDVLLGGERMKAVLDTLRTRFDLVLLDTAPALLAAPTIYLAPWTDGVVVVAAAGSLLVAVEQVRENLVAVGGVIIGGILNKADRSPAGGRTPYGRSGGAAQRGRKVRRHPQGGSEKAPTAVRSGADGPSPERPAQPSPANDSDRDREPSGNAPAAVERPIDPGSR